MQKTSLTEAGQTDSKPQSSTELIDAINQVFGLFRINFHNQYYKAFPDADTLNPVKKLWLESLQSFSPSVILKAAKSIIESTEYLPTLNRMIRTCDQLIEGSAPDPHAAYVEACRAPSPKNAYKWSHPAVYHAGQRSDWYFLSSTSEAVAFPIFKNHYNRLIDEIRSGAHLSMPSPNEKTPQIEKQALDKTSAIAKLKSIRNELNKKG